MQPTLVSPQTTSQRAARTACISADHSTRIFHLSRLRAYMPGASFPSALQQQPFNPLLLLFPRLAQTLELQGTAELDRLAPMSDIWTDGTITPPDVPSLPGCDAAAGRRSAYSAVRRGMSASSHCLSHMHSRCLLWLVRRPPILCCESTPHSGLAPTPDYGSNAAATLGLRQGCRIL
jgi:hypothetical protein